MKNIETVDAVHIDGPGQISVRGGELLPPSRSQLWVEVEQVGVCSGELGKYQGREGEWSGRIGHEMVGRVVRLGSEVEGFSLGDRVTGWTPRGDAMAQAINVESAHMVHVSDGNLSAVHSEPLMCCVLPFRDGAVKHGQHLVFVGLGYMGLITMMIAKGMHPASITVVARSQATLDRALEFGATRVIRADDPKVVQAQYREEVGQLADVVFESTGTQGGLDQTWALGRMKGVAVIQGYHQEGERTFPLGFLNWWSTRIVNGHWRGTEEILANGATAWDGGHEIMDGFRRGVNMTEGGFDLTPLATHHFGLQEAAEAFRIGAGRPADYVKAIITM